MNITENILQDAGFVRNQHEELLHLTYFINGSDFRIIMEKYRSLASCNREWACMAESTKDGFDNTSETDIETVEQFNGLMKVMNIDFSIKEEEG